MKILAITNQKGGVGKTTTSVNLAACLATLGQRVLLIDLDPQGNATTGCGIFKKEALPSVYQILLGAATLEQATIKTEFGFDVIPANRELAGAEVELIDVGQRERRLKEALDGQAYDFVLIDCPPALNLLTVNALAAAQAVMIPMQCEYYALEGLTDLVTTLRKVRANLNPALEIEGLLRTMYNSQSTLNQQVSAELESHFSGKVYRTVIPRNVRLAEAPSYGKPVIAFDKTSKGALSYLALAEEMLERIGGAPRQQEVAA
ncbi:MULTISPECIES: ParA family protein [Azospira]|uniref:ATPase involved in chromosome partitioning n=2 Tax=Azospira oryzae TaxID=146939 RepID=G8QI94_AZOOP|nr:MULTISPECIES: ParA family protein [Azospira]MBP7488202.1 ParA family protein [Azospira sp.]TLS18095.1 MAG: ParA family protein [Betaproteobacteria bacterium]AEV25254.1 ATPase involved in chromosome partitioning [Azospira oryzae PS]MDK9691218.1 AAA family ATPase [Azospira sp.]RZT76398.1 chromosome segregation ATPase [Azospira oryzae]